MSDKAVSNTVLMNDKAVSSTVLKEADHGRLSNAKMKIMKKSLLNILIRTNTEISKEKTYANI